MYDTPLLADAYDRIEIGLENIEEMTLKIRQIQMRLRAVNDRTTSYANRGRRNLEFVVRDMVWLRVAKI